MTKETKSVESTVEEAARPKPRYEKPVVVALGGARDGAGAGPSCYSGSGASDLCLAGSGT